MTVSGAARFRLSRSAEPLPRSVGWAAFAVYTVFAGIGYAVRAAHAPLDAVALLIATLALGWLALLGRDLVALVAALAAVPVVAILTGGSASNVGWFCLAVLVGATAMTLIAPVVLTYWALAMIVVGVEAAFLRTDDGWGGWLGGITFSLIACWFGSRQRDLVLELRDAQAGLAARAQADERNRIARELHDVIAHSLTVSLLHVSSARLALRDDPADAERALAEAERLGRASLDEVRHAVGTLHRDGAADPTAPLPGSTDLPTLVAGFQSAGAEVSASFEGDLDALPATVGLAAYRIVQESLTNAVKHAERARTVVLVAVDAEAVRVDVDSAGRPGTGRGGLGLISMRERAESVGGRLDAGPGGSGWRVHADLPLNARLEGSAP